MNPKFLTLYENLNFKEFIHDKNSSLVKGEFLFLYEDSKLKVYQGTPAEQQSNFVLPKGIYLFLQENYPINSCNALIETLTKNTEELSSIFKKYESSFKEEALWRGKETYGPMMLRVLIEEEHEAFQLFWAVREKESWM